MNPMYPENFYRKVIRVGIKASNNEIPIRRKFK